MRPLRWIRNGATLVTLGAVAGAVVVTARYLLETPQPLESALAGEGRIDRKHGGDIYYNVAGPHGAQPLVLLHDFYQGASNYEFRRVFPRFASAYRVYAPDWLGFGMSEHPALTYTGEFYAAMLTGFLRDVVTQPAIVIAHGRAANIAVRAASDTPAVFDRLILVAPDVSADERLDPTLPQALTRLAQRVSLGILPYALISGRPLLRLTAARRTSHPDRSATESDLDHLYASSHQFGGHHAPLSLLTGELDLPMRNVFPLLEPPTLIMTGEQDGRHAQEAMEELAILNPHADLDVIPGAGENVFEDEPSVFTDLVTRWLGTELPRQPATPSLMAGIESMPVVSQEPAEPPMPVDLPAADVAVAQGGIFSVDPTDLDATDLADTSDMSVTTPADVMNSAAVATAADVADRAEVGSIEDLPTEGDSEPDSVRSEAAAAQEQPLQPVAAEPDFEVVDAVIESPGEAEALTETRAETSSDAQAVGPTSDSSSDAPAPLFTPRDAVPTRPLTRRPTTSRPAQPSRPTQSTRASASSASAPRSQPQQRPQPQPQQRRPRQTTRPLTEREKGGHGDENAQQSTSQGRGRKFSAHLNPDEQTTTPKLPTTKRGASGASSSSSEPATRRRRSSSSGSQRNGHNGHNGQQHSSH